MDLLKLGRKTSFLLGKNLQMMTEAKRAILKESSFRSRRNLEPCQSSSSY